MIRSPATCATLSVSATSRSQRAGTGKQSMAALIEWRPQARAHDIDLAVAQPGGNPVVDHRFGIIADQSTSTAAPSCSFIAASPYILRHSIGHRPPALSAISRRWSAWVARSTSSRQSHGVTMRPRDRMNSMVLVDREQVAIDPRPALPGPSPGSALGVDVVLDCDRDR